MSRMVRIAVLACSLPLALPHGWCCLFAVELSRLAGTTAEKPGCCCACVDKNSDQAKSSNQPTRLPPGKCPCDGRTAVLLEKASIDRPDLDFAFPPVLDHMASVAPESVADDDSVRPFHPFTPRLHVFECVWRC